MIKFVLLCACSCFMALAPSWAHGADVAPVGPKDAPAADQAQYDAALTRLFIAQGTDKLLAGTMESMVGTLVKQNDKLQPAREQLLAFFQKHLGWSEMESYYRTMYRQEFTVAELNELTAFYNTEVGKKMNKAVPKIMASAMEFAQAKLKEHQPELRQIITDAMSQ